MGVLDDVSWVVCYGLAVRVDTWYVDRRRLRTRKKKRLYERGQGRFIIGQQGRYIVHRLFVWGAKRFNLS